MNTTLTNTETQPRIFITDYASYNDGSQFKFGHWLDLSKFSDTQELEEYLEDYFNKADNKRPLDSPREEWMITDFEGFPKVFYSESYSPDLMESLFTWLGLACENYQFQYAFEFIFWYEHKPNLDYAIERAEDLVMYGEGFEDWEIFEMYYPDAEKLTESNPYLSIDYAGFISDTFIEWTAEDGSKFYVDHNY